MTSPWAMQWPAEKRYLAASRCLKRRLMAQRCLMVRWCLARRRTAAGRHLPDASDLGLTQRLLTQPRRLGLRPTRTRQSMAVVGEWVSKILRGRTNRRWLPVMTKSHQLSVVLVWETVYQTRMSGVPHLWGRSPVADRALSIGCTSICVGWRDLTDNTNASPPELQGSERLDILQHA